MTIYIISNILLIIGFILLSLTYLNLLVKYLKYNNTKSEKLTGYDICKKLIDNNKIEDVKIIETRNNKTNIYNINRKVIKLSENTYYSNNYYNLAISTYLSGLSILDSNKNINIKNLSKILSNISYLNITSILVLLTSILFKGYYAIIGIIILIILFIYLYTIKNISNEITILISKELNSIKELKNNNKNIITIINSINLINNTALVIAILQICRLLIYIIM